MTAFDGDLRFEALVFGWACAEEGWNGECSSQTPEEDRRTLGGYFEQWLEQADERPRPECNVRAVAKLRAALGLPDETHPIVVAVTAITRLEETRGEAR